ncbi:TBC1 domain family member 16-like [Tubulanus polymorphus]|uniref:TBC1 domain family member 16-like n=1 Tax=Tubulanus polymorphus TaxID=672921 RepID=UPI003DA529EF
MSLSTLLKKATNFLGLGSPDGNKQPPIDGEIIYCKNNVCVHPPSSMSTDSDVEHHPGYLTIRAQDDELLGSTLILTWIPNSTLKRNPLSIENSPMNSPLGMTLAVTPKPSPRPSPRRRHQAEYTHDDTVTTPTSPTSETNREKDSSSDVSLTPDGDLRKNGGHSLKSQTDSGIGHEDIDRASSTARLNLPASSVSFSESREPLISDDDSSRVNSPDSDANYEIPLDSRTTRGKRNDSNRSVASIEMEGEHLVVVTEAKENDVFESFERFPGTNDVSNHVSPRGDTPRNQPDKRSTLTLDLSQSESEKWPQESVVADVSATDGYDALSSSSGSTSGPDSRPPTPVSDDDVDSTPSSPVQRKSSMLSCASQVVEALQHNLTFPENSLSDNKQNPTPTKKTAKEQMCGVFSVDLGQMRSLRLFYNDDTFTSGQMVLVSRESQYKILHFHHGGMDKLATVFEEWKFFAQPNKEKKSSTDHLCKQFSVIRPKINRDHYHPEEGLYDVVDDEMWRHHMNSDGQIEEQHLLRKAIFFGSLHTTLRSEAWPFLLHYYPFDSTFDERETIRNDRYIQYNEIRSKREAMSGDEQEKFWRNIQSIVEKDVVRTDRSHPYFRGEGNPNVDVLKHILLNYAVANPHLGYTQGMSDLLAPILAELKHEADAYWCFVGLMQHTIFCSSPKDTDMDRQLGYLRGLLKLMLNPFYKHLCKLGDAMDLLFCHRWILLCFKREFPEDDAMRIWESCWAHYQTDYFHLFICVAIISVYGEDVVQQDLPADEMLLHFSSLSMHMSGVVVLRKARGLLHQFRTRRSIPCTLIGLSATCGPGIWDSGHVPAIRCVGHTGDEPCPNEVTTPPS